MISYLNSFKDYVMKRPYHFGRGNPASWQFIAAARGDPDFPDAKTWKELYQYLQRAGTSEPLIKSARIVWSSFQARKSRIKSEMNLANGASVARYQPGAELLPR